MKVFYLFILFICFNSSLFAQCCAGCSPIGGTTNQGSLEEGTLRTILNYRNSFSEGFLEGDSKRPDFHFPQNAGFNHVGFVAGYGITHNLTFEMEWGYYINRWQYFKDVPVLGDYYSRGFGLTNSLFSFKYKLAHSEKKEWEITTGIGAKVPLSDLQVIDGVRLSRDVQPVTPAFGVIGHLFLSKSYLSKGLRFFIIDRFELNGQDKTGYKYGNKNVFMFFSSYAVNKNISTILQSRLELSGHDRELRGAYIGDPSGTQQEISSSGNIRVYISPQVNFSYKQKWNLSFLFDIPVYQYCNGLQLANKYSFAVSLNRLFKLYEGKSHLDGDIPDPFN